MKQFDKVAKVYTKVRPSYPEQVYEKITEWYGSPRIKTAVDIGCGSGQSITGLKKICTEITGVEPGDNLRAEAIINHPDVQFVKGQGEQTNLPDDCADLVTIATAFYWMDREKTLKEINRILKAGGVFVTYRYLFPIVYSEAHEIIERHCTDYWDKYREERLVREDDSDILMRKSGFFSEVKKDKVTNIKKMSPDDFVSFLTSTSYVSKYLEETGDQADNYVKGLISELEEYTVGGTLDINFDIYMFLGKKKRQ